jgi:putative tryptophan/tyrosine transport system substrate-binding protein
VFSIGADPVKIGLVNDLARPGGNITGMSHLINALSSKRLSLLRELVPRASTFGLLVDPTNPNSKFETADMQAAVDLLGYKLVVGSASTATEVDTALTNLVQQRIEALAVAAHAFFLGDSQQLAALALHHRVPAIYAFREDVVAGGLISYGGSLAEAWRYSITSTSFSKATSVPGSRHTATVGSPTAAKPRVIELAKFVDTSLSPTFAGRDLTKCRL